MSVQQQATSDDFRRLQRMAMLPPHLQAIQPPEVPLPLPPRRNADRRPLLDGLRRDRLQQMSRELEPK